MIYGRIRQGKLWPASRWIAPSSALWCRQEIRNGHTVVEQGEPCSSAQHCQHRHALSPLQMASPSAPSSGWTHTADGLIPTFLLAISSSSSEILCLPTMRGKRSSPSPHTESAFSGTKPWGKLCPWELVHGGVSFNSWCTVNIWH